MVSYCIGCIVLFIVTVGVNIWAHIQNTKTEKEDLILINKGRVGTNMNCPFPH